MRDDEPIVPGPLGPLVWDKDDPGYNWPAHIQQSILESRRGAMPEVHALLAAGWRFELPGGPDADPEPWQWYWRRPPRRKGSRGQFYASTGQAYNALMRQTPRG